MTGGVERMSEKPVPEQLLRAIEARQNFLLSLWDRLRDLDDDPGALLLVVAESVARHLRVSRVGYASPCEALVFSSTEDGQQDFTTVPDVVARAGWLGQQGPAMMEELQAGRLIRTDNIPHTSVGGPAADSATIAVPVQSHGRTVAFLFAQDREPRSWNDADATLLRKVADRTWAAVERTRAEIALRSSEARFRFLSKLDDATRRLTGPHEITHTAAQLLGEHLGVNRCAYADVEADQNTFNLTGDYNAGVESIVGRYTFAQFGADCLRLMREGKAYVVTDSETDPRTSDVLESYRRTQIRSVICVSLLKAGRFVAAMAVHQSTPRQWRQDEVELVQQVASRCWESIERTHIERELWASQDRLRAIYDGTYEYIGLLTPDGILQEANRASLEFTGSKREDVVGRPFWDTPWFTATPGAPEAVRAGVARAAAGEFVRYEATLRHPSGEYLTFDISLHPVRNQDGEVVLIVPEGRNITDRKRAEEELRESEVRFRLMADSAPVLIWISDTTKARTWFNRRWHDFTGRSAEQEYGQGCVECVHPDDRQRYIQTYDEAFDRHDAFQIDYRLRRYDGEWRWVVDHGIPRLGSDGRFAGYIGSCIDITDRKSAEAALQRTNEELVRANSELEEFAYVSSHDLQEPLRMVNIYTQLLLKQALTDNDEARKYAAFIRQGVLRMEVLIHDLLSYSRIIYDSTASGTADLSLSVTQALETLAGRIAESGAAVHRGMLPTVRGDTAQLAQVFQNLISNSLKYRKREVTPEIYISARKQGREWIISLQDNGIGFRPQYAERIFGLFKRLHKDAYPGTGLGLAICQRIVQRHGGKMWAEGQPDEGATFSFTLPVQDTE
jgi:PAS domain S-box-containing protein